MSEETSLSASSLSVSDETITPSFRMRRITYERLQRAFDWERVLSGERLTHETGFVRFIEIIEADQRDRGRSSGGDQNGGT